MTCEVCRFGLPEGYPWRAKCAGCGNLHALCVDCGCRYARRTGLQPDDTWAELDACPDEAIVAQTFMGEIGERSDEAVWRVMREFSWEPADERTALRMLEAARASGLPVLGQVLRDAARPGAVGLRLADGREVWSS